MGKRRKKTPNFILRKQEGDFDDQPSRIERSTEALLEHLTRSNQFGRVYALDTPIVPVTSDLRLRTARVSVVQNEKRIDGRKCNVYAFIDQDAQVKTKVCFTTEQRKTFLEKFARETR